MYEGPTVSGGAAGAAVGTVVSGGTLANTGAPIAAWLIVAAISIVIGLLLLRAAGVLSTDKPRSR